jgi:hypothetical protein
MLTWLRQLWTSWRQPQQMDLPFACAHYGEVCGPFVHDEWARAFYGQCVKCRTTYDPPNDR